MLSTGVFIVPVLGCVLFSSCFVLCSSLKAFSTMECTASSCRGSKCTSNSSRPPTWTALRFVPFSTQPANQTETTHAPRLMCPFLPHTRDPAPCTRTAPLQNRTCCAYVRNSTVVRLFGAAARTESRSVTATPFADERRPIQTIEIACVDGVHTHGGQSRDETHPPPIFDCRPSTSVRSRPSDTTPSSLPPTGSFQGPLHRWRTLCGTPQGFHSILVRRIAKVAR